MNTGTPKSIMVPMSVKDFDPNIRCGDGESYLTSLNQSLPLSISLITELPLSGVVRIKSDTATVHRSQWLASWPQWTLTVISIIFLQMNHKPLCSSKMQISSQNAICILGSLQFLPQLLDLAILYLISQNFKHYQIKAQESKVDF